MERFPYPPDDAERNHDEVMRDLVNSMSQPFDTIDNPVGYQLSLDYVPPANADLLTVSRSQLLAKALTDCQIDPKKPWNIQIGYDPKIDRLGANSLAIPLKSDVDNDFLHLVRTRSTLIDYIALRSHNGKTLDYLSGTQQMEEAVYGTSPVVSTRAVHDLLSAIRYNFTEADSKIAFQQMTAEALAQSPSWTRREEIVSPIHPDFQAHLIRETHFSETRTEVQSPFDGRLEFQFCRFDDDKRIQKVLQLPYEGYFFEKPTIQQNIFCPNPNPAILREEDQDYIQTNTLHIPPTPPTIASFARAIDASFGK